MFVSIFAGYKICKSNDAHYCDTVETKQKAKKRGKLVKITKTGFMKTGCSKKKEHLRKKNVMKSKLYFKR